MTQTVSFDSLNSATDGRVLVPGDPGYDEARTLWNGEIDRRPAVIVECLSAADVAAAVTFAQEQALEISVRGGGHSFSGASAGEAGMMINLARMNQVVVDPEARRVRVGGGATMADMDAANQAYGVAVTGGVISHTGVGGLTLGGGMGWLTHLMGLAIDNLVSAEVVLADSSIVRASADEHPDLFWALRGGGGNFGVVTEFEYRTQRLGPEVHVGLFFWSMDNGSAALRLARELLPTLPARAGAVIGAGMSAPPAPFVPEQYHFAPGYALIVAGYGTAAEHAAMVAPIRDSLPPLFEFVSPLPYAGLQQLLDDSAPWGIRGYEKALDITELSDEVIAVITEHAGKKTSPMSFMPIFILDGAFAAVGEDETSFGGARTRHYVCNIVAAAPDNDTLSIDRTWVRETWEALRPLASNSAGYVNFMAETDDDRVRAAYGAKYERLADIKYRYDPANVFHRNANIKPARSS
ncbi:FAD-binding oxidoreductase [Nocardia sp. NPDC058518]|uniref:FAD-binding oxidoreductase n=1 Tax=Nocardia sp. NPDC058518 TaxID=3346534 RepID=UPI003649EF83